MIWGIAETAPEIEKIKAESADYLGGLNSCGEIEWGIYSQAFDFYADLIQKAYELGKTEAKLHWIPVTERLPEEDTDVLVTVHFLGLKQTYPNGWNDHIKETYYVDVASHICGEWHSASDEYKVARNRHVVIAWQSLPEPFKGVTDGRD